MTRPTLLWLLAALLAGCSPATPSPQSEARRSCSLPDAAVCDAIVRQVSKQAGVIATPPVVVVVPRDPDGLNRRGGDFPMLVAFATLDRADPISTWIARKVALTVGNRDADWTVRPFDAPLPNHLIAALRAAQGESEF